MHERHGWERARHVRASRAAVAVAPAPSPRLTLALAFVSVVPGDALAVPGSRAAVGRFPSNATLEVRDVG